ncbi:MAG: hypothetical protein NTY71_05310 [Methanoregula sp.]|nr:hypothetical protein [Methanoregula sp.]
MPRRPTMTEERVPLFLLPHMVMRGIRTHGEELEWVMARRMSHHYYSMSIRTQPVRREFQKFRLMKVPARARRDEI